MVFVAQQYSGMEALVQQAMATRQLRRQDHLKLTSALLSNPGMPAAERFQINRLLDYVRTGKVRLID